MNVNELPTGETVREAKLSEIPILTYNGEGKYESTCLSNGVIALRPGKNPLLEGTCIVSGFVEQNDVLTEQLAKAPYPFYLDLRVEGVLLSETPERVRFVRQELDMGCGELRTEIEWAYAEAARLLISITQFVSRTTPSLAVSQVVLASEQDCRVEIFPRIGDEALGITEFTSAQEMSKHMVSGAALTNNSMVKAAGYTYGLNRLGIALILNGDQFSKVEEAKYAADLAAGGSCKLSFIAAFIPEVYTPDPHLEAIRLARWGEMLSAEVMRQYNREAWEAIWESRIVIDGATASEQLVVDSSFYYLQGGYHYSVIAGAPPYGLTQNVSLNGHTFWDMDIWMLPPIALVQPEAARSHIEFRKAGLEGAYKRAKLFGYKGAQYPWQATKDGYEGTTTAFATGWSEQHISPNVAVAAWMYQQIAGDPRLLRDYTWQILEGVADWIASRGVWTERGFEVRHMMGVDEELENVSNDGYFNLMAKMAVTYAIECAELLGYQVDDEWRRIAAQFYLPRGSDGSYLNFDPATRIRKINPQTLEVEEKMGIEQVDPSRLYFRVQYVMHFSPPIDYESLKKVYLAEEATRHTWHSYSAAPGTEKSVSFIIPPFSTRACFFDDREKGLELLHQSYEDYLLPPFQMIREYKFFDYGSYMTTYGAILSAVMMGFTGLRPTEPGFTRFVARLPAGWRKITLGRITLGGKPYRLEAEHGEYAVLTPLDGD